MAIIKHSTLKHDTGAGHEVHAFEFADAAARNAGTGYTFAIDDEKKIALQLSDNTLWVLASISPLSWAPVAGVTGTVALGNGGTGQTSAQTAINALAGAVTSAQFLRGNGTNVVMSAIQASDVPTLNQATTASSGSCTGNAVNVTGTVALGNGGTGQTSAQTAINALAGSVTSAQFLRGNGTNVTMSAIQASDVPTLNQATTASSGSCTGNAANVTGTVALGNGGTGQTSAQTAINALAGAVTSAQFLRGNGTNVVMSAIQASDVPSLDAGKITSGTIDIARIPVAALERMITVADQPTRYLLTTDTVQLGDTVKQTDTGLLYLVVDVLNLGNSAGYQVYVAGSAATAASCSGNAVNVTGTVALGNGGTGQTSAQTAINALAGAVTSAQFLRGNGTNVVMSAIQASDVPTLNQATTASAGSLASGATGTTPTADDSSTKIATTAYVQGQKGTANPAAAGTAAPGSSPKWTPIDHVHPAQTSVSGNAANVTGTVAIGNGGTGQTSAQTAINALAGAVTSAQFLRGNGTNVVMSAIQASDVPTLNQSTSGTATTATTAYRIRITDPGAGNYVNGDIWVA